ncbi:hypothetical protein [Proteiniphilum sp.]|uniref:hypothetical protein n=1 Tax=Proteiniphilum sp. TaxID=1926877 RepID=UPI002B1EBA9E|nr:hypothetical protein [Proteiniphilum sp.]MEA4916546.1 hypothetical protein [Proteiniphilum sp.]MEA4948777.1 hypothetical protein [Petrimonas sp.]
MEKIELPAGITAEMIMNAKNKYGENNVKYLDLPLNDESTDFKTVLAAVPTRNVMGQYRRYADTDPKKADEILVKNCLLSHKDEVLADDGLFYGALTGIGELIPIRKAIVKNC